eukprot:m.616058 g.616058  ORF g.616058 m.616058 type:complete len:134 (+) comp22511_c0_seq13:1952-2353(+)
MLAAASHQRCCPSAGRGRSQPLGMCGAPQPWIFCVQPCTAQLSAGCDATRLCCRTEDDGPGNAVIGGAADNMLGAICMSEPDGPLAGLGFGMPMSKMYCEYFGGSLQIQSMHGYGTDAYVTLTNLSHGAHRLA